MGSYPVRTARKSTPPKKLPNGATRLKVQRVCNGCGEKIGDVTYEEMQYAIAGLPLPDLRQECLRCSPSTSNTKENQ